MIWFVQITYENYVMKCSSLVTLVRRLFISSPTQAYQLFLNLIFKKFTHNFDETRDLQGEGEESRKSGPPFYCTFFWKQVPLMLHPSYQDGGNI